MYGVLDKRGEPFEEPVAYKIFSQIVDGLEVAHSLGLAHHDMSFENLMTDDAEGYSTFIIDWGAVVKVAMTDRGIPVRFLKNDWGLVDLRSCHGDNCRERRVHTSSTFPFHECF